MATTRYLTGVTTTGTPHLGNYVGAIRPAIAASHNPAHDAYYFLADYHALIKCEDPEKIRASTRDIAATWLALGLDPERTTFYRQSDIPEIPELCWVLQCSAAKGLLGRAHAYKAARQANQEKGLQDLDTGISMGLFSYPVLMAADILLFQAQKVPVGKDQIQHIEMARDMAQRFNSRYQTVFTMPEAVVDESIPVLTGTDGRKMSKSYHNTLPIFQTIKQRQKAINKIKTNLLEPGDPKQTDDSVVFTLWCAFADADQQAYMRTQFEQGIGWGQAKKELCTLIHEPLQQAQAQYQYYCEHPEVMETILQNGASKARQQSIQTMGNVRQAIGISPLAVNP